MPSKKRLMNLGRDKAIRDSNISCSAARTAESVAGMAQRMLNKDAIDMAAYERARIAGHERRTHLGFTPNPYTPEQWQALCDRHDNRCARCGGEGPLTVDHILPVSKGGLNNIENIQPLCLGCNLSKHTDETDYRKAV